MGPRDKIFIGLIYIPTNFFNTPRRPPLHRNTHLLPRLRPDPNSASTPQTLTCLRGTGACELSRCSVLPLPPPRCRRMNLWATSPPLLLPPLALLLLFRLCGEHWRPNRGWLAYEEFLIGREAAR